MSTLIAVNTTNVKENTSFETIKLVQVFKLKNTKTLIKSQRLVLEEQKQKYILCEPSLSQFTPGLHPALLKMQEISDPFQLKPFHDSSGANAKVSSPQSSLEQPYQGLQVPGLENKPQNTKVPHITCKTLPQQLRAMLPRAGPQQHPGIQIQGICIPRDKAQQAETRGKGSRCCRNLPTLRVTQI